MATTYNNYADVQAGLTAFVNEAGVNINGAPHGAFWESLTYEEFITGDVPGVTRGGPWPILVKGDSGNSNIIQILNGIGKAAQNFGRMPRPRPPYEPEQSETITALAAWIDAGCQNTSAAETGEVAEASEAAPDDGDDKPGQRRGHDKGPGKQ